MLNTKRDHRPSTEQNFPFYTGSITRRTPVHSSTQGAVKSYSAQDRVNSNRTERSFQYDTKPIIKDKTPPSHSIASPQNKSKSKKKDSDYVSVKALIKQWSVPDTKSETPNQPVFEENYKNRRSLPANFDASEIFSEKKNSAAEDMHHKRQREYISKSDWSLETRPSSEKSHGLSNMKQDYVVENRTRRKSEPSAYSEREYDPVLIGRNKSSSVKHKEYSSNRDVRNNEKENIVTRSTATRDVYAANTFLTKQLEDQMEKDVKSKDDYAKHPVMARKSFPLTHHTKVNYTEDYKNQTFYQPDKGASVVRHNLESTGKYATMPSKGKRENHHKTTSGMDGKERETKHSDAHLGNIYRKADEISGKATEKPPKRSTSERISSTHRRLPTYEEAILPLKETEYEEDGATKRQINNKSVIEKDYVSLELLQQKRERIKGNPSIIMAKRTDYSTTHKLGTSEKISRQYASHVYASEPVLPTLPAKDEARSHKLIPKRRNSQERIKNSLMPHSVASANTSMFYSNVDAKKTLSKQAPQADKDTSRVKDFNNNKLPVYDGDALKTMLTTQQFSKNNSDRRKSIERDSRSKVDSPFVSENARQKKEHKEALKKYESLTKEQITSFDLDFKDRRRNIADQNVARQLTKQEGDGSSNVQEGDLLELVAAEEKYWKGKVERKEKNGGKETPSQQKEIKEVGDKKQERVHKMLQEFKMHDGKAKIDYSELTDTLRAEEEYLAQEAEKILKQRFKDKSVIKATNTPQTDMKQQDNDSTKSKSSVEGTKPGLHSILKTRSRSKKRAGVTSPEDINLKPEADQAYHNQPKKLLRSRSPVYICSGCRLPVEKDICLYVAELQSYWHEKCFRCSVCHSNLIQNEQTPRIRVMFSRIHCEKCLSNKGTG